MIPISLNWDTREKSFQLKWNGFISSGWRNGKMSMRVLRFPIPFPLKKKRIRFPVRLPRRGIYLRGILSFLIGWKLKKVEGTLSFSDPMVNGVLYGWMSVFQTQKPGRKIHLTVNFSGENWCRGEATLSLNVLFHHIRRWIFPFICEMRRGKPRKGGG
jgi:hypothetical protein